MKSKGFGNGMEFLPTIEDYEKNWLWIWENADNRKQFEEEFEAEDPEAFQHFHDYVLVNHPEYEY